MPRKDKDKQPKLKKIAQVTADNRITSHTPEGLRQAILTYYSTPEAMRSGINTIRNLEDNLNINKGTLARVLMADPDLASSILHDAATYGATFIPHTINMLVKAITAGSIRACEILLDFVRKTVTDEALIRSANTAHENLNAYLEKDLQIKAGALLAFAQELGSKPEAVDAEQVRIHTPQALQDRTAAHLAEIMPVTTDIPIETSSRLPENSEPLDLRSEFQKKIEAEPGRKAAIDAARSPGDRELCKLIEEQGVSEGQKEYKRRRIERGELADDSLEAILEGRPIEGLPE